MTRLTFIRFMTAFMMLPLTLFNFVFNDYAIPAISREGAYLFCYFVGNEVNEQTIHLAVSTDGYNFEALNNNEAVITQTKGTGCVRDPYILKGPDENGKECYFIVATDMNALDGWTSNHAIITWRSYDLVNWIDETVIDMRDFEGFETTTRAWAPQAIWDEEKGMYMVYWANSTLENDTAGHYYAYTKDFKTFETEPQVLFGRWNEVDEETGEVRNVQCIDGDIIYNEKDGYYYLYFKEDLTQKIAYVKSKNLTGPYNQDYTICSLNWWGVEGSTMYRINGTNAWMMIMDEYSEGTFFGQMTRDFNKFKRVQRSRYGLDHLRPRHGSVVSITEDEYFRMVDHYGVQKI
ncbi:MAG: glycoside hydrolase family 43 protein, partial [Clostridia bacterium]|nr:glycoside hydrolase family 43 protein [Clostridia bacterium]